MTVVTRTFHILRLNLKVNDRLSITDFSWSHRPDVDFAAASVINTDTLDLKFDSLKVCAFTSFCIETLLCLVADSYQSVKDKILVFGGNTASKFSSRQVSAVLVSLDVLLTQVPTVRQIKIFIDTFSHQLIQSR